MLRRVAELGARVLDFLVVGDHPMLPDYAGACVHNIVPALIGRRGAVDLPSWMPAPITAARQVVLFVVDGLGWEQLRERPHVAPTLCALAGGPIYTVAPSTTATALTSISTGLTPGEHGVVGYRIDVHGEILNVLRWSTPAGDARKRIPPAQFQPIPPFLGANAPVVTKAEFTGSGFSMAHLAGVRQIGFRMPSSLVVEVRRLLAAGEPFVYAYYEGIDKVAHEYGLDEHYEAELGAADRLVADLLTVLPPDAALLVTADHGQVDCGDRNLPLDPSVRALTELQSGEGRFRWLHARSGADSELLDAATDAYGEVAWVVPVEQVRDDGWLGPRLSRDAAERLGSVALVAREPVSFDDPADSGPFRLVSRHGSLTSAEMLVPLLAGRNA
jgi:predicted AlkP superfamily pyrophosphatase or phosphodiesterase